MNKGKRVKRTANRGQSSSNNIIFETNEVETYFTENAGKRGINPETGILEMQFRENPLIQAPIEINKWRTFIKPPPEFLSKSLVREFYANAYFRNKSEKTYTSFVRGKEISFDADNIARVLALPIYHGTSDHDNLDSTEDDLLETIKSTIFLPEKQWNVNRDGDILHVHAQNLRSYARFWSRFVLSNLLPSSHHTEIKPKRVSLIYCICGGKTIDAAKVISEEMLHLATNKSAYFSYPRVITLLCQDAGISLSDDVKDLKRAVPLSKKVYQTYETLANSYIDQLQQPAPEIPPQPHNPQPSSSTSDHSGISELKDMMSQLLRTSAKQEKRQLRLTRMSQNELRRNAQLTNVVNSISEKMGMEARLPPYTEDELTVLDTTSDDTMEEEEEEQQS